MTLLHKIHGTGLTADVISLSVAMSTYKKETRWEKLLVLASEKGGQWEKSWHCFTRNAATVIEG